MKLLKLLSVMAFALFLFIGCGSGGSGGSDSSSSGEIGKDCIDVSGTWSVVQKIDASECGEGKYTEYGTAIVVQNGCNVTLGDDAAGTVSGNKITGTSSWSEGDGTVYENFTLTVSGDSFSGSSTMTYRESGFSCSGTSTITGTKQ